MTADEAKFPRFAPVGERAVLITFDEVLSEAASQQVRTLDWRLQHTPLAGVVEWIPAFNSLMVLYDPAQAALTTVISWIEACLVTDVQAVERSPRLVEISVQYGGDDGPDLPAVAAYHGLTQTEVVERHTRGLYRVGMMGFMPGFAYLLGLDPDLTTPRLATPRTHVPAGSVGIAGNQTGIYPLASPGGWQLIGRTSQVLFDPLHEPYFTLAPGDEVRFIPAQDSDLP
jgi:inhibitor of KinA